MQTPFYPFKSLAIALLLMLLLNLSCTRDKHDDVAGCYCSSAVDSLYRMDAYLLVFADIYANPDHPDRNNPFFDEQKVNEVLNAIQAVYNLPSPERNEVFIENQVHVYPFFGLQAVSLQTDTAATAVKKLIAGQPTGQPELDHILSKYKFNEVQTSLYYPDFNWITLIADEPLNLFPVIDELKAFPFFWDAGFGGGAVGDGNTIQLSRSANQLILDFSIGWGDCPAGCIYRKHWLFSVDQECRAVFINSYSN